MFGLNREEISVIRRLDTPIKIQNFINQIPRNFESTGETYLSPRRVLREWRAHCFEGALLAAAAFWFHGERPLILDLRSSRRDLDHVVALFQRRGLWGAISKTNYAVLRYREPIYRNVRELALSFFHEYVYPDDGSKTLRAFSQEPFDLSRYGDKWVTEEKNLRYMIKDIDNTPHEDIISKAMIRQLRRAEPIEIEMGKLVEWLDEDGKVSLNPILAPYVRHYKVDRKK